MRIINSTPADLETIFQFYGHAVDHQKKVFNKQWQPFDPEMVKKEINEQRQWKIVIDNKVACIFAITFSDSQIWKERDSDPSLYLHRIVTHPDHRGEYLVKDVVAWAKEFGRANQKICEA